MKTKEKNSNTRVDKGLPDDDDGPSRPKVFVNFEDAKLTITQLIRLRVFKDKFKMANSIRTILMRNRLRREYVSLLRDLVEIKRKIKALDEIDGVKKVKSREQDNQNNQQNNP